MVDTLIHMRPYGPPIHTQQMQAFLFNEGPGPRKVEIWEPITSITCA